MPCLSPCRAQARESTARVPQTGPMPDRGPPSNSDPARFVGALLASATRSLQDAVRAMVSPALARRLVSDVATICDATLQALQDTATQLQVAVDEVSDALPVNWRHLTWPQILAVVELMRRCGWSLVGTPPPEVIIDMLAADSDHHRKILLVDAEPQILHDLTRMLGGVKAPHLTDYQTAASEAVDVHAAGATRAAQALAGSTLSALTLDHFGHRHVRHARRTFRKLADDEAEIRELVLGALLLALATTLEGFDALGQQRHENFNRSESAHRISAPQYTPANSLTALMLLVATLVDADALIELQQRYTPPPTI